MLWYIQPRSQAACGILDQWRTKVLFRNKLQVQMGKKKSTISYKNVLVGTQKTDYLKSALDVNVQYHTTRETADYRRSLSRRQLGLSVLIRHKKLPQENRICRQCNFVLIYLTNNEHFNSIKLPNRLWTAAKWHSTKVYKDMLSYLHTNYKELYRILLHACLCDKYDEFKKSRSILVGQTRSYFTKAN